MKKIVEYGTPIYAALIFLGYLNYHFYYNCFDIEIASHLTTSELLFSFLPITVPFVLMAIFLSVTFLGMIHLTGLSQSESNQDEDASMLSITNAFKGLKEAFKTTDKWFKVISIFFETAHLLWTIAVNLFLIGFIFVFLGSFVGQDSWPKHGWIAFFSVPWLLLIFYQSLHFSRKSKNQNFTMYSYIVLATVFVGFMHIFNRESAKKVLDGKPKFSLDFTYNGKHIETDTNLVYVGHTSEYLFLRDLRLSENQIRRMDQVSELQMTAISYQTPEDSRSNVDK